ncbi:hypothetical protein GTO27_12405 [Candidatus Bathyarchaeota archaeon]|nr:hypothetical protein [Candidatus Bathyarchaeota archaeon]
MDEQIEDRRIRGIARQIGFLKSQIRKENRKNLMRFFIGLATGLLANVVIEFLTL